MGWVRGFRVGVGTQVRLRLALHPASPHSHETHHGGISRVCRNQTTSVGSRPRRATEVQQWL